MSRQHTSPSTGPNEDAAREGDRDPILSVRNLTTEFATEEGTITAIEDVSFELEPGERLGIVGESGSGKSVTARTVMRLLDDNGRIASGEIRFKGTDVIALSDRDLQRIRGDEIAMVFQDPMSSLTPVLTVGTQIVETIETHRDVSRREARERAIELLDAVRIPKPHAVIDQYPHELSGGQRQRVLIAIAMSCDPDVLIADEPTTALDVTIEAQILDLLLDLADERGMSLIQISHDLGVIAETCDRVAVMYAGRMVEQGPVEEVFHEPRHPYTAGLLRSTPRTEDVQPELLPGNVPQPHARPDGCNFAPRCPHATDACLDGDPPLTAVDDPGASADPPDSSASSAPRAAYPHTAACILTDDIGRLDPTPDAALDERATTDSGETVLAGEDVAKEFTPSSSLVDRILPGGEPPVKAVDGVDIELRAGETVGLVGESGSGKTTLGRLLNALTERTEGTIRFEGRELSDVPEEELRSRVQFVFQDPSSSLNPRQTIDQILRYAVAKHGDESGTEARTARVVDLLREVGLDAETRHHYPHQLSGGQKQRVGVARALAVDPDVLIADEPTSALDVSVQGQLLALLEDVRREHDLAMLFISHDLSVIRHISDRVAVMYLGRIVETGPVAAVFENPRHPYTEALLSAIPSLDPHSEADRIVLEGEIPDPQNPPSGCNFVTRCPRAMEECHANDPELVADSDGADSAERDVACFLHTDAVRE